MAAEPTRARRAPSRVPTRWQARTLVGTYAGLALFPEVSSIAPRQSVSVVRRSAGWGTDVPHPAGPAPPKRFARPRPAFGTTTGAGAASVPYETIGRDTTSSESAVAQPSQP